jgi:hypothetical protein
MTDQHRATPEQISMRVYPGDLATDPRKVAVVINALSARIEALEADQLEQAESHRFCTDAIVRRVEALELAQQDKLDRLIALDAADPTPDPAMPELRAASAEVTIDGWHKDGCFFSSKVQTEEDAGKVYIDGELAQTGGAWQHVAIVIFNPTSAEARPAGGLVERVEIRAGGDGRAAIREVAAAASQMHASQRYPDKNLTWERVAQWLELEADHG